MFRITLILGVVGFAQVIASVPAETQASLEPLEPLEPLERAVVASDSLDAILDAVRMTETGGQPNGGRDATGDRGSAIGPFQIHRAYFQDAKVAGSYADCRDPQFARSVVVGYWKHWCPDALERRDAEILARVHNGGPRGAQKRATLAFWDRVERRLEDQARATLQSRGGESLAVCDNPSR